MKLLVIVSSILIVSAAAQIGVDTRINADCVKTLATSPDNCCKNIPEFFEQKVVAKCRADFNKNGIPTPCFAECLTNSTSILKAGQFQKEQAFKVMSASADASWKSVINVAIDKCIKEYKLIQPSLPTQQPSNPQNDLCSLVSGAMIVCIRTNIFMECPNYSTDAKCLTLKDEIPNCPIALIKRVP